MTAGAAQAAPGTSRGSVRPPIYRPAGHEELLPNFGAPSVERDELAEHPAYQLLEYARLSREQSRLFLEAAASSSPVFVLDEGHHSYRRPALAQLARPRPREGRQKRRSSCTGTCRRGARSIGRGDGPRRAADDDEPHDDVVPRARRRS